jgi:alpha-galactosidase
VQERDNGIKLVLIGAGSAVFTKGLVADMIQTADLAPWTLGLVDIDPEALETADGLCRRMVEATGADIAIEASTDRTAVMPGADAVVSTIGVGGRRAWEADVLIPREYGIYQPVGDTVMPGGISRAMRMIPALVEIAEDVKRLCPEAWFFNYSNPMAANCWAVREATDVPVVGLCHGTHDVSRQLAQFVGAPPEETTTLYAGLNHLTFIFDLRWQGRDMWPVARKRLDETPAPEFAANNPFSWSLSEAYGAYPSANDRHVTEFFPERFPGGAYGEKTLGVDAYAFEDTIARGDDAYARMREQALGEAPLEAWLLERSVGEHEQLMEILRSIRYDRRGVFAVNVPNRGAVPNLPQGAILEVPAVATATGLRPVQILDFPDTLAAVIARKVASIRLTVSAALAGSRALFVEALLADGAVADRGTAEALADDLLEAHRAYLPNFFGD